jgi:hypothetical protein
LSLVGHGTVDITLWVYAHLLADTDNTLAEQLPKRFG